MSGRHPLPRNTAYENVGLTRGCFGHALPSTAWEAVDSEAGGIMRNAILSGLVATGVAAGAGCHSAPTATLPDGGAVVTFPFSSSADTLDVLVLDSATIALAEQQIATGVGPRMPIGPIVRRSGIDPRYQFHYVESEMRLGDLATEVCDGRPMRSPAEVDWFFELATGNRNAPRATWCPWGATPIAVQRR